MCQWIEWFDKARLVDCCNCGWGTRISSGHATACEHHAEHYACTDETNRTEIGDHFVEYVFEFFLDHNYCTDVFVPLRFAVRMAIFGIACSDASYLELAFVHRKVVFFAILDEGIADAFGTF